MHAGIGVGVGECGQVWAWERLSKGGWVWMDLTDQVEMGDISSGSVCLCVQV